MNIVELDDYFINLDNVTGIEVQTAIESYGDVEVYKLDDEFYTLEPIISHYELTYAHAIGDNIRIRNAKNNSIVAQSDLELVSRSSHGITKHQKAFGDFDNMYDKLRSTGERIKVANTKLDVRILFHFTGTGTFEYVLQSKTREYNENFEHTQPEFDLDVAKQEAKRFIKSLYKKTLV